MRGIESLSLISNSGKNLSSEKLLENVKEDKRVIGNDKVEVLSKKKKP